MFLSGRTFTFSVWDSGFTPSITQKKYNRRLKNPNWLKLQSIQNRDEREEGCRGIGRTQLSGGRGLVWGESREERKECKWIAGTLQGDLQNSGRTHCEVWAEVWNPVCPLSHCLVFLGLFTLFISLPFHLKACWSSQGQNVFVSVFYFWIQKEPPIFY